MKNYILGLAFIGSVILALGIFIFAAHPSFAAAESENSLLRGSVALAFPKDSRFLFDAINLELLIPNQGRVIELVTRPSQHIFVYFKTDKRGFARKYGLQIIPQIAGQDIMTYDELSDAPVSSLTFRAVVNCIEELDTRDTSAFDNFKARYFEKAPCATRNMDNEIYETVRDLRSQGPLRAGSDFQNISFAPDGANQAEGLERDQVSVRIAKYSKAFPEKVHPQNPFAKTCQSEGRMTVCATRVHLQRE